MKRKILLTRPLNASNRWAALLAENGFDCVVEPLLHITPTHMPMPDGQFQAVMITSANAPEALAEQKEGGQKERLADLFALPCFCVGASTAEGARLLGFTRIYCGTSDSTELAYLIIGTLGEKTRPILHIAGDVVDGKAQEILSKTGFSVTPWVVYNATAAQNLSDATRSMLASGEISLLPVFSPRSARLLVSMIEKHGLTTACYSLTAVGLSQSVADVLQNMPWRRLRVAATPSEESVLASIIDCLKSESAMPPLMPLPAPPIAPMPESPSSSSHPKKKMVIWGLLAILFLSVGGAVALNKCPWFQDNTNIVKENARAAQNIDALEDRVRLLESRLDMLQQNQSVTPADSDADMALSVKALQAQIAQMQKTLLDERQSNQQAAQKWVAAAFAFWDLRNAANEGRSFAPQLAALHDALGGDDSVAPQMAVLFSYSSGVPTLAQLHDDLAAHEPAIETSVPNDAAPTVTDRVKKILSSLISVHPLHSPAFDALEKALSAGDDAAALAAFNALPEEAKQKLSPWQTKLQSRLAVDDALHLLAAHFTAPAAPVTSPAPGGEVP